MPDIVQMRTPLCRPARVPAHFCMEGRQADRVVSLAFAAACGKA
jgi:hypothetical protein